MNLGLDDFWKSCPELGFWAVRFFRIVTKLQKSFPSEIMGCTAFSDCSKNLRSQNHFFSAESTLRTVHIKDTYLIWKFFFWILFLQRTEMAYLLSVTMWKSIFSLNFSCVVRLWNWNFLCSASRKFMFGILAWGEFKNLWVSRIFERKVELFSKQYKFVTIGSILVILDVLSNPDYVVSNFEFHNFCAITADC